MQGFAKAACFLSLSLLAGSAHAEGPMKFKSRDFYAWGYEPIERLWEVKPLAPTG
jgi:hypothetical protein